mmetsp:Transcript_28835/g.112335  ORF Transcript_28835/g.112335 Transcript_28835/m.112335 type:complete len:118 (+) Transcript_28835:984-1337(+)
MPRNLSALNTGANCTTLCAVASTASSLWIIPISESKHPGPLQDFSLHSYPFGSAFLYEHKSKFEIFVFYRAIECVCTIKEFGALLTSLQSSPTQRCDLLEGGAERSRADRGRPALAE